MRLVEIQHFCQGRVLGEDIRSQFARNGVQELLLGRSEGGLKTW